LFILNLPYKSEKANTPSIYIGNFSNKQYVDSVYIYTVYSFSDAVYKQNILNG